jgi:hypothetical protein
MDPWFLDNRSKKSPALNLKDPAQAYLRSDLEAGQHRENRGKPMRATTLKRGLTGDVQCCEWMHS